MNFWRLVGAILIALAFSVKKASTFQNSTSPLNSALLVSVEFINHNAPKITQFPVYFGQSPFHQLQQFCSKHGVTPNEAKDELLVLLSAMESLKNKFDAHIAIHYITSNTGVQSFYANRSISFELAISNVCVSLQKSFTECMPLAINFLENSWPFVDKAIRFAYSDLLYPESKKLVDDNSVLFLIHIDFSPTNFGGPGIGNVLKALVSFESIHANTKVQNRYDYIIGNYSLILEETRVFTEGQESWADIQLVFTHRLLVLRSEEANAPKRLHQQRLEHINHNVLLPFFSKNVSVDHVYDRFAIPRDLLKRILGGFHRIPFKFHIKQLANKIINECPKPCLVVAVRSGKGAHEKEMKTQVESSRVSLHDFDQQQIVVDLYINSIINVLRLHSSIRGISLLFDDLSLVNSFIPRLKSLGKYLPYFYHDFGNDIDPLIAAAIDLLVLSSGSILLGKRMSTFFEVAHWLGDLRKPVYFVPDKPPLNSTDNWVESITDPSINRIYNCLSICYRQFRANIQQGKNEYNRCEEQCEYENIQIEDMTEWKAFIPNPYAARFLSAPSEDIYFFDDRNANNSCKELRLKLADHLPALNILHFSNYSPASSLYTRHRILCVVFTTDSKHESELTAVIETWGRQCGGFLAFSNVSDISFPTITIDQEGPDVYDNLWRKLVAICKYIFYNKYIDEFDWILFADDDTYIIIDNLEEYLASDEVIRSQEIKVPFVNPPGVYLGKRLKIWESRRKISTHPYDPLNTYNSGGSGIILDRTALSKLVQGFESLGDPCGSHSAFLFNDVPLAKCLYRLGIVASDTRDSRGRERFHHFKPSEEALGPIKGSWWDLHLTSKFRGLSNIAPSSISFHRIKAAWEMRAIHSYITKCQKVTLPE